MIVDLLAQTATQAVFTLIGVVLLLRAEGGSARAIWR